MAQMGLHEKPNTCILPNKIWVTNDDYGLKMLGPNILMWLYISLSS